MSFKNKVNFYAEFVDGVLCIIDTDGPISVTNDVENVIDRIREVGIDLTKPVIYRNSEGVWDGLLIKDGKFAGFIFLNTEDRYWAIHFIKEKMNESKS